MRFALHEARACAVLVLMLVSGRGSADPLEPPPEAPEAQDYVVEADDSLSSGESSSAWGWKAPPAPDPSAAAA